ncbi:transporter, major facilitator family protein [Opisthorchis viverrini]|uniref:Transporter, major facilitator family protein n=1 Tax=Opisthorchis viverrini TaxID=6198 RepID=A0A1S8WIW6_OPIVI|nr:transporter, major facilitator family protein [Opisthorchis viverrini]
MVPYIMGYTKARVDKEVKNELSVWLSALALGVQGFSMPLGGVLAKKIGFRWVVAVSCLLESGGVLATYFTIQYSFIGVMITYSLIKGGGLGLGYSVVLAVATSWFPARRGLVVGLTVAGFGMGALVFTPVQTAFINPHNVLVDNVTRQFTDKDVLDRVPKVFLLLGGILLGLQIIGFCLLRQRPTSGLSKSNRLNSSVIANLENTPMVLSSLRWDSFLDQGYFEGKSCTPAEPTEKTDTAARTKPSQEENQSDTAAEEKRPFTPDEDVERKPFAMVIQTKEDPREHCEMPVENLSPKQVIRRVDFYLLWIVMFCNVIPVTIITSAFKYFGQKYISDDRFLSIVATTSSLFNSSGRIAWGALVDRISFKVCLLLFIDWIIFDTCAITDLIPLCMMLTLWAAVLVTFPHLALAGPTALRVLYFIWVCLLWLSLSGVFAIMPSATGILFGQSGLAINYGMIFSAFAAGSVMCGLFATFLPSKDAYLSQFTGCACVCLFALFTTIWIADRKMSPKLDICHWCSTRCASWRGSGKCDADSRMELEQRAV